MLYPAYKITSFQIIIRLYLFCGNRYHLLFFISKKLLPSGSLEVSSYIRLRCKVNFFLRSMFSVGFYFVLKLDLIARGNIFVRFALYKRIVFYTLKDCSYDQYEWN